MIILLSGSQGNELKKLMKKRREDLLYMEELNDGSIKVGFGRNAFTSTYYYFIIDVNGNCKSTGL